MSGMKCGRDCIVISISRASNSPRFDLRRDLANDMDFRVSVLRKPRAGLVARQTLGRPLSMQGRGTFDVSAVDAASRRWKSREPRQPRVKKTHPTAKCAALEMVIRGSDLNQSLQKLVEIGFRGEPQLLPRLVRLPEFERVEMADAARECGFEIGSH